MIWILTVILVFMNSVGQKVLFDFAKAEDVTGWQVINDGVMGGMSKGHFEINDAGNALFYGDVSLENNGGFSSVRYRFEQMDARPFTHAVIRLKGDGKRYQFRVKSEQSDRHSYIQYFQTNGDWQEIEIRLDEMYPGFRGRRLDMPDYPGIIMEEVAFLIANKRAESFRLEIANIRLK